MYLLIHSLPYLQTLHKHYFMTKLKRKFVQIQICIITLFSVILLYHIIFYEVQTNHINTYH